MVLELRAAEKSRFSVFLSSPDEDFLVNLRDRVDSLVGELNAVLHWQREEFRFEVVRWETIAAQRASEDPLLLFVEEARRSHITLVLLADEMKDGTREEIEGAIAQDGVQISLIRFTDKSRQEADRDELGERIQDIRQRGKLISKVAPTDLGSDEVWIELFRWCSTLLSAGTRAFAAQEPFAEGREGGTA
jgi:hypothetical protein